MLGLPPFDTTQAEPLHDDNFVSTKEMRMQQFSPKLSSAPRLFNHREAIGRCEQRAAAGQSSQLLFRFAQMSRTNDSYVATGVFHCDLSQNVPFVISHPHPPPTP